MRFATINLPNTDNMFLYYSVLQRLKMGRVLKNAVSHARGKARAFDAAYRGTDLCLLQLFYTHNYNNHL
jgi:hypothetical protein